MQYVPSGNLVYAAASTVRAVAFDLDRLEVIGTPFSCERPTDRALLTV